MDILKKLLIIMLVCFPIAELGRYIFPNIGQAPLLLNDIAITVLVCYWLGYTIVFKKTKSTYPLRIPIFLWIGIMCVSLLSNSGTLALSELFIASLYILRWCLYVSLFFIVVDVDTTFKKTMLYVLIGVGQVIVFLGFIQYFFYPSLRNLYYLGWDEHLYRMFSVFFDPNFAGVFFVLVFLLTLGKAIMFLQKKQRATFLLFFFLVFDGIAIYVTYSRSALLALLIATTLLLVLYGKKKFLLIVLAFLLGAVFLAPKSLQTEGTNLFRVTSSEARLSSAATALSIIQSHPILGVGFNAYRYAQRNELSEADWDTTHAGAGTDNSFLFVLATTGIIGFVVYISLLFHIGKAVYVQTQETHNSEVKMQGSIFLASLGGVCVSALFINSLFYVFLMQWLWILLGCTLLRKEKD